MADADNVCPSIDIKGVQPCLTVPQFSLFSKVKQISHESRALPRKSSAAGGDCSYLYINDIGVPHCGRVPKSTATVARPSR